MLWPGPATTAIDCLGCAYLSATIEAEGRIVGMNEAAALAEHGCGG